jgi:membrane protease YdiL (CAAX protease family)
MFSAPVTIPPSRGLDDLSLPLTRLEVPSLFDAALGYAPVKALLPIPVLLLLAPLIWWFFRDTWYRLDVEAREYRLHTPPGRDTFLRPALCLSLVAVVLTVQEYYGGRALYDQVFRPLLLDLEGRGASWIKVAKYDEFYGYCWWVFSRVAGYVLIPLPIWKLFFPKDSLLDMGLRVRGFFSHIWIYGLCLAIVAPTMLLVARQPDFGTYYPFYKLSSRSWYDFLLWEAIYFAQFFALELFFRGFIVGALRPVMGSAAIFVMSVPYCMIHYGKPYLEAHGAIVAGIVLGSLAMRTRSIYAGFLVHVTVAFAMDLLALWRRAALPVTFWAPG